MIPMPPSQWVRLRQKKNDLGVEGKIGEDRRPGGGEAGDRFKIGIERSEAEKEIGDAADGGGDDPGQRDDEQPFGAPHRIEIAGETTVPATEAGRSANERRRR